MGQKRDFFPAGLKEEHKELKVTKVTKDAEFQQYILGRVETVH